MIQLERLNGEKFMLNPLMIEQVQSHPDTTITMYNGKKLVVKTAEEDVIEKITAFYQKIGLIGQVGITYKSEGSGGYNE